MKIPDKIKFIMQRLLDEGHEAYIIGGAVRDHFMGVEPHDYDIFCSASKDNLLKLFPEGKILGGKERQNKLITIVIDNIEISQFRTNGSRTSMSSVKKYLLGDYFLNITNVFADSHEVKALVSRINTMDVYVNALNNGYTGVFEKGEIFFGSDSQGVLHRVG